MTIIHLEDNATSRITLARMLGIDAQHRVKGQEYLSTEVAPDVETLLREGTVSVLVLDLTLDIRWSNENMEKVLHRLIVEQKPLDPQDEQMFDAYRVALLAHARNVPVALLTNWADKPDRPKWLTVDGLRQAFHVDAVITKDDLTKCAAWVKQKIR